MLIASGYSLAEAAEGLGLAQDDAQLRLARLQDELEQAAGLQPSSRRCVKCGDVALRPLKRKEGFLCEPCARNRPCSVCGRVTILTKNLCPDCFPEHTDACVDCGKLTRRRPGGRCSPCEKRVREAGEPPGADGL